jgi:hypothetical protein
MCRHAKRQVGQRAEGRKIGHLKGCAVGIHHRQLVVAVGCRPPMSRQMLQDWQDPASLQALRNCPGYSGYLAGFTAVRAVANHHVTAGGWQVSQRQAIDVDT